jgi:DNA (cytosine-5)-methyltransferase 1
VFGGLFRPSLGFSDAGFATVGAVEVDKWAAETYGANHPGTPVYVRDVRSFKDSEIRDLVGGSVDVIAGGPPCQGFSHANSARRDPKDPRNSLFQDFVRFAEVLRPSVCLVENVPGLLRTKMGSGQDAIEAIEEAFCDIGYLPMWKVLNAANFGVPQSRERLFIAAL